MAGFCTTFRAGLGPLRLKYDARMSETACAFRLKLPSISACTVHEAFTRYIFLFAKLACISPRHSFLCCFTEPRGIAPQREQHSSVNLDPLTPEQIEFSALRFVQVLDTIENPSQGFPCT